jgi:hypothetical protein
MALARAYEQRLAMTGDSPARATFRQQIGHPTSIEGIDPTSFPGADRTTRGGHGVCRQQRWPPNVKRVNASTAPKKFCGPKKTY